MCSESVEVGGCTSSRLLLGTEAEQEMPTQELALLLLLQKTFIFQQDPQAQTSSGLHLNIESSFSIQRIWRAMDMLNL